MSSIQKTFYRRIIKTDFKNIKEPNKLSKTERNKYWNYFSKNNEDLRSKNNNIIIDISTNNEKNEHCRYDLKKNVFNDRRKRYYNYETFLKRRRQRFLIEKQKNIHSWYSDNRRHVNNLFEDTLDIFMEEGIVFTIDIEDLYDKFVEDLYDKFIISKNKPVLIY